MVNPVSYYNNSCVANMMSDITFTTDYFQEKNYNFVTLAQLTKYSRNTTKLVNSLQKAYTYNWSVFDETEHTSWINSCT